MSETTYYQINREVIKRAKDYYENNKILLKERAKNKYRESFEKNIKRENGKNRYHNMSEEKKKKTKRIPKKL